MFPLEDLFGDISGESFSLNREERIKRFEQEEMMNQIRHDILCNIMNTVIETMEPGKTKQISQILRNATECADSVNKLVAYFMIEYSKNEDFFLEEQLESVNQYLELVNLGILQFLEQNKTLALQNNN